MERYISNCDNILLTFKNNNIYELANELNVEITCVYDKEINNLLNHYDVVFSNLYTLNVNELVVRTKKYLILFDAGNDDSVKNFMELNDDWIYMNDEWTCENKITVIKKKEDNEKNIICVMNENSFFYNPKSFELFFYYFNNNYKMVKKNSDNIINFIEGKNKKNNVLVFIHSTRTGQFDIDVMTYIQTHIKFKSQIYIIEQDWWVAAIYKRVVENHFRKDILIANNYKVIVIADNVKILEDFNNIDCIEYQNNIICYNYWGIYKSDIVEFKNEPIKKILLSGSLHKTSYPERIYLSNLINNYIEVYKYNNNDIKDIDNNHYSKKINEYLCCFSSSVYVVNIKRGKIQNTHLVLLKNFEILASGSLLLVPNYEEPYLKKLGLINGTHYLTLDFNNNDIDMNQQINVLMDENNLSNINEIRYNGYIYAINNLTNKQKFIEINEMFIS